MAYGKYNKYDSLAPEFETYETIKELARAKTSKEIVKTETICTDGIDNDKDGLIDSEDGDCWVKEGAIFIEDWYPLFTYKNLEGMIPIFKDVGIKTIQLMGMNEHCSEDNPSRRWATRDFYKLDPKRGSEEELMSFLEKAHSNNLKVLGFIQTCCILADKNLCPKGVKGQDWDEDRKGSVLYHFDKEGKGKYILRDVDDNRVCHPMGWGYSADLGSEDLINYVTKWFSWWNLKYEFDGYRLDAPAKLHCPYGEYFTCSKRYKYEYKIEGEHNPLNLYREMRISLKPNQIFLAEVPFLNPCGVNGQLPKICRYPYYPSDTLLDEIAEVSIDTSFTRLLTEEIITSQISSKDLVNWLNNEPILYERERIRYIRRAVDTCFLSHNFVSNDPRYFPSVVLISTIPGIPMISAYELFGSEEVDIFCGISAIKNKPESRLDWWKKILSIRNNHNALKYGSIKNVWKAGDKIYAYLREYEDEMIIVIINFQDKEITSHLNLAFVKQGGTLYDELNDEKFMVNNPTDFEISVPSYGSRILVLR